MQRFFAVIFLMTVMLLSLTGCYTFSCCKKIPSPNPGCPTPGCSLSGPVSPFYRGGCRTACAPCVCLRENSWGSFPPYCREQLIGYLAQRGVQVVEIGEKVQIILYTDNCFEPGTAEMYPQCYPTMDGIVRLLQQYRNVPMRVTGYTDFIGDICDKWPLSQHIADSVTAYLWTHGISLDHLYTRGCACNNPIATPCNPAGNSYNRRVEILLGGAC